MLIAAGLLCIQGCSDDDDKNQTNPTIPGNSASIPAQKIDIGGYGLNVYCAGNGSPTVVLESGGGDDMTVWYDVFFQIASMTTVCAYDRAGLGESDMGPMPRSSRQIAHELHALLGELSGMGVASPYILVGHSLGGAHIRVFADQYPAETAGFVFVDPTVVTGTVDQITPPPGAPVGVAAEFAAFPESMAQANAAKLPDVPLVLISAMLGKTPEEREMWYAAHQQLLEQVSDSTHLISENSEHYVHTDEPELVVNAIQQVYQKTAR